MAFHWLFPTPVLQVDLTPEAAVAAAMEAQLVTFDSEVFAHPEFSDRNNLTGDLLGRAGLDQGASTGGLPVAERPAGIACAWVPAGIAGACPRAGGPYPEGLACGLCSGGGNDQAHTHRNAQLSAVFYVRTDADNATGELEFQAPEDYFSHVMAIPYKNAALSGGVFAPKQHRLLIFPSDLTHRVTPYEGSSPRYSVSYDLAITTPPGEGREMRMPHPMDWVPLSGMGPA